MVWKVYTLKSHMDRKGLSVCHDCGDIYVPSGAHQRYCKTCRAKGWDKYGMKVVEPDQTVFKFPPVMTWTCAEYAQDFLCSLVPSLQCSYWEIKSVFRLPPSEIRYETGVK